MFNPRGIFTSLVARLEFHLRRNGYHKTAYLLGWNARRKVDG